jgi:acyl-CoA synthetase (AMP-forming)/AMP-acid ligase II
MQEAVHESTARWIMGPPLADDSPWVTVTELVRAEARRHPGRTALIDGMDGRAWTYGQLDRLIGRCAAGLAALGFGPGDTLLMFATNSPQWPLAALAAMQAGGVVSGANPLYGAAELAEQIRDSGARFIVAAAASLATARAAAESVGGGTLIVIGGSDAGADFEDVVPFDSLLESGAAEPPGACDPDALAALPYSSGTTGLPKGVMLSHRNIVANVRQCAKVLAPEPAERVLLAYLPMFHIYGLTVISVFGLAVGATIVTLPRFEPESFLRALSRHRVTHLHTVPPVLQFLASHPLVDDHDLSALSWVICGAAPLGSEMEARAAARLRCDVFQGFGMTESSGVIASTYPGRGRRGASGQLLPGTAARVIDPVTGADLPRGVPGELWFRGPQAFLGYWNRPQETAATLTDGWVRTGDIGYVDEDGYLYITDRLKELIKVKGFQVPPAELEALLVTHPAVADAAVIGRPDERSGELPVAYIVARGPLDATTLQDWVAERVVEYKRLADVMFCPSIPKTPSGKILRRALRVQDAARLAG